MQMIDFHHRHNTNLMKLTWFHLDWMSLQIHSPHTPGAWYLDLAAIWCAFKRFDSNKGQKLRFVVPFKQNFACAAGCDLESVMSGHLCIFGWCTLLVLGTLTWLPFGVLSSESPQTRGKSFALLCSLEKTLHAPPVVTQKPLCLGTCAFSVDASLCAWITSSFHHLHSRGNLFCIFCLRKRVAQLNGFLLPH